MRSLASVFLVVVGFIHCSGEDFPRSQGTSCVGNSFTTFVLDGSQRILCNNLPHGFRILLEDVTVPDTTETRSLEFWFASYTEPAANHLAIHFEGRNSANDRIQLLRIQGGNETVIAEHSLGGSDLATPQDACLEVQRVAIDSAGQVSFRLFYGSSSCSGTPVLEQTISTYPPYEQLIYLGSSGSSLSSLIVNELP